MRLIRWVDTLWGKNATSTFLWLAAVILLFGMLGSREIWTQEHRWADIVTNMFFHRDFLHPILNGQAYYDKPLLSYWLMAGISALTGNITTLSLRIPSACAGLLAIWSIYTIGLHLENKRLGLLAAWLMLTTYYFIFWARTSSADMLNLAGSLFGVAWYIQKRYCTSLFDYTVFFFILTCTALCKGLVGPIVTILAILPDLFIQKTWKNHLNKRCFIGMLPAAILYLLPFMASTIGGHETYPSNGLYQVYRENILRYFHPFDHKGPIYTYLIYLPLYLLPWSFFFIPTLMYLKPRWPTLSINMKWMVWSLALLLLFFTCSGSRRSYYVLPIVPYALLLTAEFILSGADTLKKRYQWGFRTFLLSLMFLSTLFLIMLPWHYEHGGIKDFVPILKAEANKIKPWTEWNIVLLDPTSKVSFYLNLSPDIKNQDTKVPRESLTETQMLRDWPVLTEQPNHNLIISRQLFEPLLTPILKNHILISATPTYIDRLLNISDPDRPIAFIPTNASR